MILAGLALAAVLPCPLPAVDHAEVERLRQHLSQGKSEREALENRLEVAERRIAQIAAALRRVRDEVTRLEARKAELAAAQAAAQAARRSHLQALARSLRTAHALDEGGLMRLWLSGDDPAVIGRNRAYLGYLVQARIRHLKEAQAEGERLARLQTELERTLASLAQRRRTLEAQHQALAEAQAERRRALAALDRRLEAEEARLGRLLADQERLQGLVDALDGEAATVSPRGRDGRWRRAALRWPVRGRVEARYGAPRAAGGRLRWRGWVIRAAAGTPVRAVDGGVVRYAGWMRGYGNLLIIDHGRERLSLYGFNQTLLKKPGEKVKAGEIVALVGDSGGREQPALYFELRQKGRPLDPAVWLAKQ